MSLDRGRVPRLLSGYDPIVMFEIGLILLIVGLVLMLATVYNGLGLLLLLIGVVLLIVAIIPHRRAP